jgi:hypothetical protein
MYLRLTYFKIDRFSSYSQPPRLNTHLKIAEQLLTSTKLQFWEKNQTT